MARESGFRHMEPVCNSSALFPSPQALDSDKENWIPKECAGHSASWKKHDKALNKAHPRARTLTRKPLLISRMPVEMSSFLALQPPICAYSLEMGSLTHGPSEADPNIPFSAEHNAPLPSPHSGVCWPRQWVFLRKGFSECSQCKDLPGTLQGGRFQFHSARKEGPRKEACHRTRFTVYLDAKDKLRLLVIVSSFLEKIWRWNALLSYFCQVPKGFCPADIHKGFQSLYLS